MPASTTNQWKLGLFVVAGVFMGFFTLLSLGSRQFRREGFRSVTYFDESVQGLDVGSPVKFRGVQIGSVALISVAPDRRHVEVQSNIDLTTLKRLGLRVQDPKDMKDEQYVPDDLRVQLVAAGITGIKFIGADFFDPARHPPEKLPFPTPHNYVPSVPSTLRSVEEAVMEAVNYVPEIANKVNALLSRIDRTVEAVDAPSVAHQARATLESVDRSLRTIDEAGLVTRTAAAVDEARETLATVRRLAGDLGADKGPLLAAIARIDTAAGALEHAIREADAGATAGVLRKTAADFGETARNLSDLDGEVRADLVAFREAMDALRELSDMLERDPSSLLRGKSPETTAERSKP